MDTPRSCKRRLAVFLLRSSRDDAAYIPHPILVICPQRVESFG